MEFIFYMIAGVILGMLIYTMYTAHENSRVEKLIAELANTKKTIGDLITTIETMKNVLASQSKLNEKQLVLN